MKIAVFGTGGLGGYFGARLLQAGHEVSFIARGAQLAALNRDGLRVESALGDLHLIPVRATDDPAEIGPVDAVLFMVKLYDTAAAAAALAPLLGAGTVVVSFQNGVDGWQRIGEAVGQGRVLGGVAYIFSEVLAPGVIRHSGELARLLFGEFDGRHTPGAERLARAFADAEVDARLVEDILVRIWEKFVLLSAISGVTALTRLPIGQVLADGPCASLFRDALGETAAVGRARCPALAADIAERQFAFAQSLPFGMRASMLNDLTRGRRLELEDLSGAVVRLGSELGLATPVHGAIYRALHPLIDGSPRGEPERPDAAGR